MGDAGRDGDRDGERGDTPLVRTGCDWSSTSPSVAIIEAIASVENIGPVALATDEETTLNEYVDPDALDTLVTDQRANGVAITVTIDDYTVLIAGRELIVERTRIS